MSLRARIGVDVGCRLELEDAIAWAAAHEVHYIDIQLDAAPNALDGLDAARADRVRRACDRYRVHLGLHTASAVNVAEYAPHLGAAVDRYLRAHVDAACELGAEWIVVHAGYHFTADKEMRMETGLDRLRRLADYAEQKGALILLENLNKEPQQAEIHYLAHTVAEWRYYFEQIRSPAFKLSFTVNHAHLVPEGVAGFVAALDMARVAEVQLADCWRNGHEAHLRPGEGDLDFTEMFRLVESRSFRGHYMSAFGSLDDMLAARDDLVRYAGAVAGPT